MSDRVCSNCGSRCGCDTRGGSLDHYLVCACAAPENSYWVSEGSRGGYTEHLNGATPVTPEEYHKRKNPDSTRVRQGSEWYRDWDNWSREDD